MGGVAQHVGYESIRGRRLTGHQTLCIECGLHRPHGQLLQILSLQQGRQTWRKSLPFNALYWDFFARHEERLKGNFRLGMVYKNLNRMTDDARAAIAEKAATVRSNLDDL